MAREIVTYNSSNVWYDRGNVVADDVLKDFYSVSDFYNFIKNKNTSPTASRFFTVVPFYVINPTSKTAGQADRSRQRLFTNTMLKKFALSIQKIDLPNFCMSTNGVDSSIVVNTPLGSWRGINNTTQFVSNNEIKFYFLESQVPIIEYWVYEWFMACLSTKHGNTDVGGRLDFEYPFPRLNLAVKYYRTDDFYIPKGALYAEIRPTFIYWITGLYPDDLEAYPFDNTEAKSGSINRACTFAFNEMHCITQQNMASLRAVDLFNPVRIELKKVKDG